MNKCKCEFCGKEVQSPKLKCITVCDECEKSESSIGFWSMVIGNEEFLDMDKLVFGPGGILAQKKASVKRLSG